MLFIGVDHEPRGFRPGHQAQTRFQLATAAKRSFDCVFIIEVHGERALANKLNQRRAHFTLSPSIHTPTVLAFAP